MRCNIMYYASVRPCVVFLEIIIFMVSCMLYTNTRAHGAITSCSNSHFFTCQLWILRFPQGRWLSFRFFLVCGYKTKSDCTYISGPFHFWAPYFWHWGRAMNRGLILYFLVNFCSIFEDIKSNSTRRHIYRHQYFQSSILWIRKTLCSEKPSTFR